jgi:hypothetical protein
MPQGLFPELCSQGADVKMPCEFPLHRDPARNIFALLEVTGSDLPLDLGTLIPDIDSRSVT